MSDQEQIKIADDTIASLDNAKEKFLGISKLLKLISNEDALLIFSQAKDGIEADTSTHSKIDLTRKQYYTRLKELKKGGLIEKKGRLYFQTTMGTFLQENCINPVIHAVRNRKKMAMIDVLKGNGKFSEEDLSQMKSVVCRISPGGTD